MLNILSGYKTYIAAIGLVALGIYQITQGDVPTGIQSILGALAAFGLHSAIVNPSPAPAVVPTPAPANPTIFPPHN